MLNSKAVYTVSLLLLIAITSCASNKEQLATNLHSERIDVRPATAVSEFENVLEVRASWMDAPIRLRFPEALVVDMQYVFVDHPRAEELFSPVIDARSVAGRWKQDGDTHSFHWETPKGPFHGEVINQGDALRLIYRFTNTTEQPISVTAMTCPILLGTPFDNQTLDRTYLVTGGKWTPMTQTDRGENNPDLTHYARWDLPKPNVPAPWGGSEDKMDISLGAIKSPDGRYTYAMGFPASWSLLSNAQNPCLHADPRIHHLQPGETWETMGMLYLTTDDLDTVLARAERDIEPMNRR